MMVGFSDGYVRGYSKSGQRVFSRLLHLESVSKLTCMASSTVAKPVTAVVSFICQVYLNLYKERFHSFAVTKNMYMKIQKVSLHNHSQIYVYIGMK